MQADPIVIQNLIDLGLGLRFVRSGGSASRRSNLVERRTLDAKTAIDEIRLRTESWDW